MIGMTAGIRFRRAVRATEARLMLTVQARLLEVQRNYKELHSHKFPCGLELLIAGHSYTDKHGFKSQRRTYRHISLHRLAR